MAQLTKEQRHALDRLGALKGILTRQQLRTIRGQILAGDVDGAVAGLTKIEKLKGATK